MTALKIILTLILVICSTHQYGFATGPSYLEVNIVPVSYNHNGEILFKTRYEVNPSGAHRQMKTEYGWLVVSASGVWEEYLYKVCEPDLNNIKSYEQCEKEFKNKFNWKSPPESIQPIIKKYNFNNINIHSENNKNNAIFSDMCTQKSVRGIKEIKTKNPYDKVEKAAPVFNQAGVFVFNNTSDEEKIIGADFEFSHLYKENVLTNKEFIENYDIDAIGIIKPGQSLFKAIKKGDAEMVKTLLKDRGRVEEKNLDGQAPLEVAIECDDLEMVGLLISAKARVNISRGCLTPLLMAVEKQNAEMVKALIKAGAGLEAPGKCYAPFYESIAISRKNHDITKILIRAGAFVNYVAEEDYRNPIMNLIINARRQEQEEETIIEVIDMLLKRGMDIRHRDKYDNIALYYAAEEGYSGLFEFINKKDTDWFFEQKDLIRVYLATAQGGIEWAFNSLLIPEAGFDSRDHNGESILQKAIKHPHPNIVKKLLFMKVKINSQDQQGNTPLHEAVERGHLEMVKLLLKHGADPNLENKDNEIPIDLVIWQYDKKELMHLLVQYGSKLDGEQLLEITRIGLFDLIKIFVNKGVSVKKQPGCSEGPIHVAARSIASPLEFGYDVEDSVRIKMAAFFIKSGASVDSRNKYGNTPLHLAVESDFAEMVHLLLKNGADVNTPNKWGSTPLHIAGVYSRDSLIKILLKNGADPAIKNKAKKTPAEMTKGDSTRKLLQLK